MTRRCAVAAILVAATAACGSSRRSEPGPDPIAAAVVTDAATVVADAAHTDVEAALVDAAAVSSDLCAVIDAVFAAQDQHLTTLIAPGPPVALRGLPVRLPSSTVQLAGAQAVMRVTEDEGAPIGGDWTAYLDHPSDAAVEALIATAAACPRIADWYSVVVGKTNRGWSRTADLHEIRPGATRVRTLEVWVAGGAKQAWVTITVFDDTQLSGD